MKKLTVVIMLFVVLVACVKKAELTNQQAFFNNLKSLCGKVFTGASTYPEDPDHDFAGQLLVADFSSCEEKRVRIKFSVGEDRSRTWVITQSTDGLLLKHDHRHSDGTPDEITNYGGWADEKGSVWRQHFAADAETATLIPAAATNVWMIQFDPNSQVLTYDLKRHDLPRYQAQLLPQK